MILKRFKPLFLIWLLFLLLAVFITWPLAIHLNSTLPAGTDSIVHYWNGWWVKEALLDGRSPYYTDQLFFPTGLTLVYHNFAWLHIIGALFFGTVLPSIAAYNLTLILHLSLCGVAGYYLVDHLTQNKTAAWVSGLIYIAWPYRLTQPDHPNLHSTWPIPLFMLMLIRLLERQRWQDGVWCGLAFALVGYMRWQLLIPATLIGSLYVLMYGWRNFRAGEKAATPAQLWGLLLAAAIGLLCLAPPITLLAQEWQQNRAQLVPAGEELTMQTDLLAYVTPAPWHTAVGHLTNPLYQTYYPDRGSRAIFSPFLGFTVIVLILFALRHQPWAKTASWLMIGITLILLALGPTLRLYGTQFEAVPTLYKLLNRFYILRLLREPDRFNMFVALPVMVLAGYGVGALSQRPRWQTRPIHLALFLSLLVLAEYIIIPLPLQSVTATSFYQTLATADETQGALLDIPLDPFQSKPYMLAQIDHGRPIAQGHASRYPDGAFDYLESDPWLYDTLAFDGQPPNLTNTGRQFTKLAADGFDYLVLHKTAIASNYLAKWRHLIPLSPIFEDESILVFQLDSLTAEQFSLQGEPISGMGPMSLVQSAVCLNPAAVFGVDVTWGWLDNQGLESLALSLSEVDVAIRLHHEGGAVTSSLHPLTTLNFDGQPLPTLFSASYEWDLPLDIDLGDYTAELALYQRGGQHLLGTVPLNRLTIQSEICGYPMPAPIMPVNARFGDIARLLGYEVDQTDSDLNLTLYWRPEQRTGVEYTVFVHLFDPETGVPVAQSDHMPRAWSYPTSRWGLDEVIDDSAVLPLGGVPSGDYLLGVGLYDGITGERLNIVLANGATVIDQRFILDEQINIGE